VLPSEALLSTKAMPAPAPMYGGITDLSKSAVAAPLAERHWP
jgi:hypothetical protein